MTLGLAFWTLVLVAVVFGIASHFGYVSGWGWGVGSLLYFVLLVLLGWQIFGPPLHK